MDALKKQFPNFSEEQILNFLQKNPEVIKNLTKILTKVF